MRFVNTARGNLTFQSVDIVTPGPPPHYVAHVYDSRAAGAAGGLEAAVAAADFGPGWRLRPGDVLVLSPDGGGLTVHPDDGTTVEFVREGDGRFVPVPPSGREWQAIVAFEGGRLEASLDGGTVKTFLPAVEPGLYLLAVVRGIDGKHLRLVREQDRLTWIESSTGASIEITRQGLVQWRKPSSWDRIVLLRDSSDRAVIFRYDNQDRLRETVDSGRERFLLRHDGRGNLLGVDPAARGSLLDVAYHPDGSVKSVRRHRSRVRFSYDVAARQTAVRGDGGGETIYRHDELGATIEVSGSRREELVLLDPGTFDTLPLQDVTCDEIEPEIGFCQASGSPARRASSAVWEVGAEEAEGEGEAATGLTATSC